jgi:hypothetical protein
VNKEESRKRANAYRRALIRLAHKYPQEIELLYQEELNRLNLKSRRQKFDEQFSQKG